MEIGLRGWRSWTALPSIGVFFFGWFWMAATFTMTVVSWWNSRPTTMAIFTAGALLAALGRPFTTSVVALLLNTLSLALLLFLVFG